MLSYSSVFTWRGPLNKRNSIRLGLKKLDARIQRQNVLSSEALGSQSQTISTQLATAICAKISGVSACRLLSTSVNTLHTRGLCSRRICAHLLNPSAAFATNVNNEIGRSFSVSRDDSDTLNEFGKHQESHRENEFASRHHHTRKDHELKAADFERLFPSPRCSLNKVYQRVASNLEIKEPLQISYSHASQKTWTCKMKIKWPEEETIKTTAASKQLACKVAAAKLLQRLYTQGKINNSGEPIMYDSKVLKNMLNQETKIEMDSTELNYMQKMVNEYETKIKDCIESSYENTCIRDLPIAETSRNLISVEHRYNTALYSRDHILKERLTGRRTSRTPELPIAEYKENIIREINNNRALLIKGGTGCGKTTQVPNYIMDHFTEKLQATKCNILISQPRRISAISLAQRVAESRGEEVGDVVGYEVRLQRRLPREKGAMLFCTSGVLLRKLQSNPLLEGCSHVILDEAHERTINTDMLLVLLKRALEKNPTLKVIVMSATINADLFQSYFNCGVVDVPGKMYPVQMNFLEDIERLGITRTREYTGNKEFPETPYVDCEQIVNLIFWITKNQPPGAILCFLPGWADILRVQKRLEARYALRDKILIVPLHSKIAYEEQRLIFSTPPESVRKIVLATDIAETGITVADVVYVVDSGTCKSTNYCEHTGLSSLTTQYASQANILQRRGRAGRVMPGTSYHLVSKAHFEKLAEHPDPEVLRSSLAKTVLDCKTYSDEKVANFLGSMPQPPSVNAIQRAIDELITLGALDKQENLTPLGNRIAFFPSDPKMSKALVYSTIFDCVAPMVTIAAVTESDGNIFSNTLSEKTRIRKIKQKYHPTSDHIGVVWLYEDWVADHEENLQRGRGHSSFCYNHGIIPQKMLAASRSRVNFGEHLAQCRVIENVNEFDDKDGSYNSYSGLDEMIRAILLSGADNLICQQNFEIRKGRIKKGKTTFVMKHGARTMITTDSVNFKRKSFPSPFLTFVHSRHSEEMRMSLVSQTSIISPLSVLLFNQTPIQGYTEGHSDQIKFRLHGAPKVKISCDPSVGPTLLKFRDVLWEVVRYFVKYQGMVDNTNENHEQIKEYKKRLVQVVALLLHNASKSFNDIQAVNESAENSDSDESDSSSNQP